MMTEIQRLIDVAASALREISRNEQAILLESLSTPKSQQEWEILQETAEKLSGIDHSAAGWCSIEQDRDRFCASAVATLKVAQAAARQVHEVRFGNTH